MRYVVKKRAGEDGEADLNRIDAQPGVRVIDRIGQTAALVEATEEEAARLHATMPGWTIQPEAGVARPTPPFPRPGWQM